MSIFKSSTRDIPRAAAVPRHIAIIMDGNGRWAKKRFLPVLPVTPKASSLSGTWCGLAWKKGWNT